MTAVPGQGARRARRDRRRVDHRCRRHHARGVGSSAPSARPPARAHPGRASPPSSWPSSSAGRACTSGREAQDRADALAAARQIAVNFSTLDYRHFDQDIARVTAGATGSFRSDFAGPGRADQAGRRRRQVRRRPGRSARWRSCPPSPTRGPGSRRPRRHRHQHQRHHADGPALPGPARPDQGPRPLAGQPADLSSDEPSQEGRPMATMTGRRRIAGDRTGAPPSRRPDDLVVELDRGRRRRKPAPNRNRAPNRMRAPNRTRS